MSVRCHTAVIFCRDPGALSRWWAEVLAPPEDGDHAAEIARLEAMGAMLAAVSGDDSIDYAIMEDPEGNGFSVYTPRG